MNRMIKLSLLCISVMFVLVQTPTNVFASDQSKIAPCGISGLSVPDIGKPVLLEDNSKIVTRGAVKVQTVDKTYSIRIQDFAGSCVNSAKVRVSGSYTYDSTSGEVLSAELRAEVSEVPYPNRWSVNIVRQWQNINGTELTYSIYYQSHVSDDNCMISGPWYSGETFKIK